MTPRKPRRLEPRACLSRCQARLGRSSGREPLHAWAAAAGSVLAPAALSYTRRHRVRARFHVTPLAARYCSSRDGGCGAGDGVRTRDLLLGKQTLCQLSYSRSGGRGVHPVRRGMYHPADDTAARSYEMHNPDATAIAILSNDGLYINREYIDKSSRIRARSSRRSIGQVIVSCPASDPGPLVAVRLWATLSLVSRHGAPPDKQTLIRRRSARRCRFPPRQQIELDQQTELIGHAPVFDDLARL